MVFQPSKLHKPFKVTTDSDVGAVRRHVKSLSLECSFSDTLSGKAEIVATEMATNLVRHTQDGGEILVGSTILNNSKDQNTYNGIELIGIELISIDSGPGIRNTEITMIDGISSVGGLGGGLGAIHRLSSTFDIHSCIPEGTTILSRIYPDGASISNQPTKFDTSAIVISAPGFDVSGDAIGIRYLNPDRLCVILIDGIGHGEKANLAAKEALAVFEDTKDINLDSLLKNMHRHLRTTQGAAVAIADIDSSAGEVHYSGVGNISGRLLTRQKLTGCVSIPGIVGYQLQRSKTFTYPWSEDSTLVMNSDGITSWSETGTIFDHHTALIAGRLCSRYRRGYDDAADLIIRNQKRLAT